jgi:hypothetical protein
MDTKRSCASRCRCRAVRRKNSILRRESAGACCLHPAVLPGPGCLRAITGWPSGARADGTLPRCSGKPSPPWFVSSPTCCAPAQSSSPRTSSANKLSCSSEARHVLVSSRVTGGPSPPSRRSFRRFRTRSPSCAPRLCSDGSAPCGSSSGVVALVVPPGDHLSMPTRARSSDGCGSKTRSGVRTSLPPSLPSSATLSPRGRWPSTGQRICREGEARNGSPSCGIISAGPGRQPVRLVEPDAG